MLYPNVNTSIEYETVVDAGGWAETEAGVLRVQGRDRVQWLHKLITAEVEHLSVGQGAHAALLDAKGHFVADFILVVDEESFILLTDPVATNSLFNVLRRYIIREQVQLRDVTSEWMLVPLIGSQSDEFAQRIFGNRAPGAAFHFARASFAQQPAYLIRTTRARLPSTDVLIPACARDSLRAALASDPQLTAETLELLRVEAGIPRWGVDFDTTTLALEIPNVLAIRVDQGCYVGQEVVARIVHRGHVNRRLLGLKIDGRALPTRGAAIFQDGNEVGSITSAVFSPRFGGLALGYLRRQVEPESTVQVGANLHARVVNLPFQH